jgi:LmbE family N-acetylglucosaminyl deacetylase
MWCNTFLHYTFKIRKSSRFNAEEKVKKKVVVFMPHPDDAEFYAGGTIYKLVGEGAEITLVIATDGCKASFHTSSTDLASQRSAEAQKGANVMGVSSLVLLGYHDLELDQLKPGILREQFVRIIRQNKPDLVIAEDILSINEIHPDHRQVALAASDAVSFSHLPLVYPQHLEEGLSTHFVVEKYYFSENMELSNKIVDITETFDTKAAALAEHKSQVEFLVEEIFMQAQLAGIVVQALLGDHAADPASAIHWAIEAKAMEVGKRANVKYGEAFRYVRFHPYVESLLVTGSAAAI